jgi:CBS domain-containing protein
VMAAPPQAPFLSAGDALWDAVDTLNQAGLDGLVVVEDGRFIGIITREAVAKVIRDRVQARGAASVADRMR